jgi:hypothetical protein
VLQIVLQLANSLSADVYASQYLTTENVCSMMTLALLLCGGDTSSMSVSSTAFATVRQLVALVMDAAGETLLSGTSTSTSHSLQQSDAPVTASDSKSTTYHENLPKCAQLLVYDLTLFLRGVTGEWIRGASSHRTLSLSLCELNNILTFI